MLIFKDVLDKWFGEAQKVLRTLYPRRHTEYYVFNLDLSCEIFLSEQAMVDGKYYWRVFDHQFPDLTRRGVIKEIRRRIREFDLQPYNGNV